MSQVYLLMGEFVRSRRPFSFQYSKITAGEEVPSVPSETRSTDSSHRKHVFCVVLTHTALERHGLLSLSTWPKMTLFTAD